MAITNTVWNKAYREAVIIRYGPVFFENTDIKSNIMHKKGKNFRSCVIIKYTELKVLNAWHGWKQHFPYLHKSLHHDNNFSMIKWYFSNCGISKTVAFFTKVFSTSNTNSTINGVDRHKILYYLRILPTDFWTVWESWQIMFQSRREREREKVASFVNFSICETS